MTNRGIGEGSLDLFAFSTVIEDAHLIFLSAIKDELVKRKIKGLRPADAVLLLRIAHLGGVGIPMKFLREQIGVVSSSMTYRVKSLEAEGYIYRAQSEIDSRNLELTLSDKALFICGLLEERLRSTEESLKGHSVKRTTEGLDRINKEIKKTIRFI